MDKHLIDSDTRKKKKMTAMKKKVDNMTREQLQAAIEKKKQCNTKAMSVVERLIDIDIEEIWLLQNLFHINQSHYQDAVEERAIIKCCGYPLCDTSLKNIPTQQYHISTKQNKVFDITDRKNYCSNLCYKASIYLKNQLYTSPLWLRDCEDIVEYKLLSPVNKTGSTGIEIDLGNVSPVKSEEEVSIKFNETLADEMCPKDETKELLKEKIKNRVKPIKNASVSECVIERVPSYIEKKDNINREKKKVKNKIIKKKEDILLSVGSRVEMCLDSWFTIDSLHFLYGYERLKEMLNIFGKSIESFEKKFKKNQDSFIYERYTAICKRLNLIELRENAEDKDDIELKPLPDYETLKVEARELEIKVKSFYSGDKITFKESVEYSDDSKKDTDVDDLPPILPLVDKHCLLATRRRIVLDRVYKVLPDVQSALGLAHINLTQEVQEFIHTLALSATNITFSPSEWNLILIIIIKLFCLRNETLNDSFNTDLTQKRIINILLSFQLDIDYLIKFEMKLNNIEEIIRNSQYLDVHS